MKTAEAEVGRLVEMLRLTPGMTVADVGASVGAWAVAFARWTGTAGRVFATDIDEVMLASMRATMVREGLENVTVLRGATASTNLPDQCCDLILTRNVYHYLTEPDAMIRSFAAALKPGGRLAVVDFPPRPNTRVPEGVRTNRGGNGISSEIVEQEVGAVLRHVATVPNWSPGLPPPPPGIQPSFVVVFEKALEARVR
jgi:SAM-dependent methyltransferase